MAFNGSGTYVLPGPALVTGDTVSATENNTFRNDVATALSTCVTRDGQSTVTNNLPMGGYKLTGLGAGSANGDSVRYEQVTSAVAVTGGTITGVTINNSAIGGSTPADGAFTKVTVDNLEANGNTIISKDTNGDINLTPNGTGSVVISKATVSAGAFTGTLTSSNATITGGTITGITDLAVADGGTGQSSYTDGQLLIGKTTGNTLVKGTLTAGTGISVTNGDGSITIAATGITNKTAQASTSGTSIDFTSIPAGTKRIVVMFAGVSTNGSSNVIIQLGDSGGIETTGYLAQAATIGGSTSVARYTNGFNLDGGDAATVWHGSITLNLLDAATYTWTAVGNFGKSNGNACVLVSGSKAISAELDRLTITTANGTDAFDAGLINISYQS